jgi:hypothetical protein
MRCVALPGILLLVPICVEGATVNLTVEEPSGVVRTGWPVTSGVPFAQGTLADAEAVGLFGPNGRELPLQTEVLAKWPDGSIRWLLLDFQVDLAAGEKRVLRLRHGSDVKRAAIDNPVRVIRDDIAITVDTGPMRVSFRPGLTSVLGQVWLDGVGEGPPLPEHADSLTRDSEPWVTLVDESGKSHRMPHRGPGPEDPAAPARAVIEQWGPMRACVRIEGQHGWKENPLFRYVVRLHAFRGQPFVRIFYTFINDYQGAAMAKLRSLDLAFHMGNACGTRVGNIHNGALDRTWPGETRRVFQVDEGHYEVNGRPAGEHAPGWAAMGGEKAGFAVGLRHFWQNWPKGFTVDVGTVRLDLCPELPKGFYAGKPLEEENKLYYHLRDGLHTFKVGLAKTHELWATFFGGKLDVGKLSSFFQAAEEPLLATCEPAYVSSTKALGEFPPADPSKYAGYDAWLSRALDAHLKRRDKEREYGMLNYGDWYGERKVNWGNLEYDLAHGLFLQYLRTGDRRFFARAEQAARHHIDVDVVHATNPHLKNPWGPPPQVGEIWLHALNHTGGYYDEKTSGLPVERTYHMGHSTNFGHVWVSGDLDYYYLTGDRRAYEVAIEIADAMARHCPTAYSDHIRGLGWPLILVLAAYDATCDKKYLDAATKCWEVLKKNFDWEKGWVVRLAKGHCLHDDRRCYGNVPFMEGLTLCALARYHRVTKDPEVLKAISVGIDQMIRECWMEDVKAFRYTPCPLTKPTPYTTLAAEAMAYEIALTGNKEHLRVLREGLRAAIPKDSSHDHGKSLAQIIHFTPHALAVLDE